MKSAGKCLIEKSFYINYQPIKKPNLKDLIFVLIRNMHRRLRTQFEHSAIKELKETSPSAAVKARTLMKWRKNKQIVSTIVG